MDKISEQCKELNMSILESEEYRSYIFARNSIKANEDLYNRVNEFLRAESSLSKLMRKIIGNITDGIHFEE